MCFFFNVCTLFSGARGFFRALSAAGHAGGPPVHQGASLGPGRAPWRALWASQVAKFGKYSRGTFRGAKAEQDNGKPTCQLFYSTVVKALYLVAATVQEQSHIKFAWTTTSVCGHCISVSAVCCNTCACV